jgi:outer membrane receptor for ferrienterochelin and colicins
MTAFTLILYCQILFAQNVEIKGKVLEQQMEGITVPLIGANVYYRDTLIGTTTNLSGEFVMPFFTNQQYIVVSYVGFLNDTVRIFNNQDLTIKLQKSVNIDEVEIVHRQKTTNIAYMDPIRVEKIGEEELLKAACCNLSESFETSPSVDVSFTDALTGARQIEMLGLSGPYIQMTTSNMPDIRGMTTIHGLEFIPGTWVESIQLIKGTGSVINGYESISGQINTEIKNPESKEKFHLNFYGNQGTRSEGNLVYKKKSKNKKWGTNLLAHGKKSFILMDNNHDGFSDMPLTDQVVVQNNIRFDDKKGFHTDLSVNLTSLDKSGGQMGEIVNPYLLGVRANRLQLKARIGKTNIEKTYKSSGLQLTAGFYNEKSFFGNNLFQGKQTTYYLNQINQTQILNANHVVKFGISSLFDRYDEQFNGTSYYREEIVPGIFSEYTYLHSHRFTAVLGMRVDYHNYFGVFATPRLHARYELKEGTVLRLTAGRGQRTSSIFCENLGLLATSRQFRFKSDSTGYNYGLNPEVAWNTGVSLTHNFKLNYRDGVFSVDFYRTHFENQIVVDLYKNAQEVWFYNLDGISYSNSFQTQLDYELFKRFDVRVAYRFFDVKTSFDQGIMQRPLVSSHRSFINLAYETRQAIKFDITAQLLGSKKLPTTSTNPTPYQREEYSPSFVLVHGQISKSWFDKFEIYLGVENLTNFKQPDPIVAVNEPFSEYFDSAMIWGPIFGRMVYFGLRYKLI